MSLPTEGPETLRGPLARANLRAVRHETYVTYRPLMSCPFCSREVTADGFVAPADEEYLCGHTRKKEHDALLMRLADPKSGATNLSWHAETLRDGTVQVVVTWAESDVPKEEGARAPLRL